MVLRDVQRTRKNVFPKYTNTKIFRHVAYSKIGLFMALVKLSFLNMPHKGLYDERRISCCNDKLRCANISAHKDMWPGIRLLLDYQPLFGKWACAPLPKNLLSLLWEVKKRTRESDENQAYLSPRVPNFNGYYFLSSHRRGIPAEPGVRSKYCRYETRFN